MPHVYIGPTSVIMEFFRAPQYDEHVKMWRWHEYTKHSAFSLHVLDYRLWKELHHATS